MYATGIRYQGARAIFDALEHNITLTRLVNTGNLHDMEADIDIYMKRNLDLKAWLKRSAFDLVVNIVEPYDTMPEGSPEWCPYLLPPRAHVGHIRDRDMASVVRAFL